MQHYKKYVPLMYDYFRKQGVYGEEELQDLVGNTIMRIRNTEDNYDRHRAGITTWLYWQMRSVFSNYKRDGSSSEDAMDRGWIPLDDLYSRHDQPKLDREHVIGLVKESKTLDNEQRAMLLARWESGLRHYEIADRFDVSYSNARKLHERAVNVLKEEYGTEAI